MAPSSLPPPTPHCRRYDEAGQKARYFADDDGVDLDTLVKRTKYGDDMDANLDRTVTSNIMRKQGWVAARACAVSRRTCKVRRWAASLGDLQHHVQAGVGGGACVGCEQAHM